MFQSHQAPGKLPMQIYKTTFGSKLMYPLRGYREFGTARNFNT